MKYEINKDSLKYISPPDDNEVLEITKKNKTKEKLPPYNIVGNGMSNKHGSSVDVLEICLQLNISEIKLLQFFRDQFTTKLIAHIEFPNIVIPTKIQSFDKYLATALMKNYKHMEYLQVIERIKRGIYMLNPKLFIPPRRFSEAVAKWNSLQTKDNK